MNTKLYLNRIRYSDELTPILKVLKGLQKAHLLHVPFENLDIHYSNKIILDTRQFYIKIVDKKRGGFCYELNGLFNTLLVELGFNSRLISARVFNSKTNNFSSEFDHLALLVEFNTKAYLVDVGFGEFIFNPIKIELNTIQHDERGDFIIEKHNDFYYKVSKLDGGIKTPEYIFSTKKRVLSDFTERCIFNQTSTDSHFTQKTLISLPTSTGRITLTGLTLKITEEGKKVRETPFEKEEFSHYLKTWFNITTL